MWQSIGEILISQTVVGVLAQFTVVLVSTLLMMYGILRMRRDTVVILSHGQLLVSTVLSCAVCTGVYQLVLLIGPAERWSKWWVVGFLFAAIMVARWLTMFLVGGLDGGRSIRDTTTDAGRMFNCNWPLISRCANQGLFLLVIVYLAMKKIWGQ
jgi:hypothetical protein